MLVSAPSKGADLTVVYGVNHDKLKAEHKVVSNASCTTNCLAPVAKVLNDLVGIKSGFMTTIHAYTNDQNVLDQAHKDMRRARAAAVNMIPTSTGAAAAVGLVLPELKGKLDGTAIRVPTPNVSVVDLKFIPGRETSVDEINKAMEHASKQQLKGILGVTNEPLVSIDFNHNPTSSTFDLTQTQIVDGRLVRVLCLVRQRVGLLQPHGRHGRRHGQAGVERVRLGEARNPTIPSAPNVGLRADALTQRYATSCQKISDQPDHRHAPRRRARPGDAGDVEHGVRDAAPEEQLRAQQRHGVADAGGLGGQHQDGEQHQALQHVAVGALGAAGPAGHLRQALAVAGQASAGRPAAWRR